MQWLVGLVTCCLPRGHTGRVGYWEAQGACRRFQGLLSNSAHSAAACTLSIVAANPASVPFVQRRKAVQALRERVLALVWCSVCADVCVRSTHAQSGQVMLCCKNFHDSDSLFGGWREDTHTDHYR